MMEDEELERLGRLLKEEAGAGAAATLAAALTAEAPFPEGAHGRRLVARAKAAIGAAAPSLPTVVVRALGEALEVIRGDGRLGEAIAPTAVRGAADAGVVVKQQLGDREVAVHFEARGDRFVVTLDLGEDAPRRQMRASLMRGGREVVSELLRQGRWLLPELSVGTWRVEVRDAAGWVGGLDLVLMGRAA